MRLNESASSNWLVRTVSCAGCGVAALWGLSLLLATMMAPMRLVGQGAACRFNLMRVTRAFQLYADDYQDTYPVAARWHIAVTPYLDRTDRLRCPTVQETHLAGFGYSMDSDMSGKPRFRIDEPGKAALVFDSSNLAAHANDRLTTLPKPGRHRGKPSRGRSIAPGNNIGYADGAVKMRFDIDGKGIEQEASTDASPGKPTSR